MPDPLQTHYNFVVQALTNGRVVPFLGASVNLCGRPEDVVWSRRQGEYLQVASDPAGAWGPGIS